jgi:CPA1 family monovalent cation:H+ antiporter
MNVFFLFSALITLAALFSYINVRSIKLPSGISLMLLGGISAIILIVVGKLSPHLLAEVKSQISTIDFSEFLLGILLSFLLFAGSMHVDIEDLKESGISILTFATFGTVLSTFLVAISLFYLLPFLDLQVPFIGCLLFGALISPTDPIAVLGILKKANLSKSIEIKITGESLFNDGIGVVIFATIYEIATMGTDNLSVSSVAVLFLQEAGGGLLMGAIIGYVGFWLMRSIDHYQTETLISLAMVMGGYSLCHYMHVSGPLAMVISGLIIGNKGKELAMSDQTRDYLEKFWEIVDEIFNALLFMLIGLELMIIDIPLPLIFVGLLIAMVLIFARYFSLLIPSFLLRFKSKLEDNTLEIMTWGGLRGGISIALALSLPNQPYKEPLVAITFIVVIFSILIQGFTIGMLIEKLKNRTIKK